VEEGHGAEESDSGRQDVQDDYLYRRARCFKAPALVWRKGIWNRNAGSQWQEENHKSGDRNEDYRMIRLLEDQRIYFYQITVKKSTDWENFENHAISYWTMDTNGNNLTQVEEIEELNDGIMKLLPPPYNRAKPVFRAMRLMKKSDWVIISLDMPIEKAPAWYRNIKTFVVNMKVPGSIRKIPDGSDYQW
jgi:hypothetical protein